MGAADWSALGRHLKSSGSGRLELSFGEIERIIGGPLPASKQYQAFWSNSSYYAKAWTRAGFESTRRGVPIGHIGFVRARSSTEFSEPAVQQPAHQVLSTKDRADVVLIGCVKSKTSVAAPAAELYLSPLFQRRRRYAEELGRPWFILSAEHGLLKTDALIEPYDVALVEQPEDYRRAWGEWVAAKLRSQFGSLSGLTFEIHAGASYVSAVAAPLERGGARIRLPLEGLPLGSQLAWYDSVLGGGSSDERDLGTGREDAVVTSVDTTLNDQQRAVVDALLAYGARQAPADIGGRIPKFTANENANRLLLTDPFAFLLGVIFDQGIPAERAWAAPYELGRRLGHLDLERIVAEPEAVRSAVAMRPALQRFVDRTSAWIVAAARMVLADYDGHAGRIWNDEPTAKELQRRLDLFPGIGQKKAAMAVEILDRELQVPIREMHGSDIAYDVHVRRVFLRTGLAQYDDLDHMVDVARRAHPERPGEVDLPAWLVGRQWCHPGQPGCPSCVLNPVCPKDVERAHKVRGA